MVPEYGYGHSFFLWDRKQQSTERQRKKRHRVRKAGMMNDPSGGYSRLSTGTGKRKATEMQSGLGVERDKADTQLSPVSVIHRMTGFR